VVCVLIGAGCQTFQPQPIGSARFEEQIQPVWVRIENRTEDP